MANRNYVRNDEENDEENDEDGDIVVNDDIYTLNAEEQKAEEKAEELTIQKKKQKRKKKKPKMKRAPDNKRYLPRVPGYIVKEQDKISKKARKERRLQWNKSIEDLIKDNKTKSATSMEVKKTVLLQLTYIYIYYIYYINQIKQKIN